MPSQNCPMDVVAADGSTPLALAVKGNHHNVVRTLLDHSANADANHSVVSAVGD